MGKQNLRDIKLLIYFMEYKRGKNPVVNILFHPFLE